MNKFVMIIFKNEISRKKAKNGIRKSGQINQFPKTNKNKYQFSIADLLCQGNSLFFFYKVSGIKSKFLHYPNQSSQIAKKKENAFLKLHKEFQRYKLYSLLWEYKD